MHPKHASQDDPLPLWIWLFEVQDDDLVQLEKAGARQQLRFVNASHSTLQSRSPPPCGAIIAPHQSFQTAFLHCTSFRSQWPSTPTGLLLSGVVTLQLVQQALRTGFHGVLDPADRWGLGASTLTELFHTNSPLPQQTIHARRRLSALSEEHLRLLHYIACDITSKSIAALTGRSLRTIESERAKIQKALGVESVAQALRIYFAADMRARVN